MAVCGVSPSSSVSGSIGGSSANLEAGIVSLEAAGVTGNTVDERS